jgi:hypothetical protein
MKCSYCFDPLDPETETHHLGAAGVIHLNCRTRLVETAGRLARIRAESRYPDLVLARQLKDEEDDCSCPRDSSPGEYDDDFDDDDVDELRNLLVEPHRCQEVEQ